MNLHHYYHIYADGEWKSIVDAHLNALESSGLMDELACLNVGIVGDWSKRDDVIEYLDGRWSPGYNWQVVIEADEGWEQVTLNALGLNACSKLVNDTGLVLYAHTKGAAYQGDFQDKWRDVMTNRLVGGWQTIVELMAEGSWDVAGCYYIVEQLYDPEVPTFAGVHGVSEALKLLEKESGVGLPVEETREEEPQPIAQRVHYSGNFWWSKLDWIRRLPYPVPNVTRWDAEMWIGKSGTGSYPRALNLREGNPFSELREQM